MLTSKKYVLTTLLLLCLSLSYSQIPGGDFEKYYKHGIDLFNSQQYMSAKKEFQRALGALTTDSKGKTEEIEYYIAASEAESGGAGAEALMAGFLKKYPGTFHANEILLLLANKHQADRNYEASIAEYKKVDPAKLPAADRAEYYFNFAYALFSQGEYATARNYFTRAGASNAFGASSTYYIAYIDYVNNDLDAARKGFNALRNDKTYSQIVPFYILHLDYKAKNYRAVADAAPALLSQAAETRREEILRIAANSHYELQEYEKALSYLETYAAMKNGNLTPEENYITGYSAYITGDFAKAIDYLGKVAAGDGILAQNASFHIGSAALRLGDKQRAKQAFSLAMRLDYDKKIKEQAMFNFAKLQYELGGGMFNETINTITTYLSEFPDSPNAEEANGYLMAAYLNSHDYAAAFNAVSKIKNPDVQTRSALQKIAYYRGLEHFTQGDYAASQKMFDISAANRYSPKYTALTKFWTAETYYRQGQYSRAIPLYQDYIVLSPKGETENTMTNYNLAYCYFNLKNMREASVWFNRFVSAYTSDDHIKADAYNRIGDIYFLNKDYAKAMDSYAVSLRNGGTQGDYAQFQRAIATGLTAGADKKIDALNAIIRAEKSEYVDDAMYELGTTYTKKQQFAEAAATLKNFVAKYPDSPYYPKALSDLGLIHQNMGKDAEALGYYKTVVSKYPNSPLSKDAQLGIRNIYVDNNDLQGYFDYAAKNNIETNVSVVEKDSLTFAVAEKIYLSGDYRRAKPLLQTYLLSYPRGMYLPNAMFCVAECCMQTGETAEALELYEKVAGMPANPYTVNALLNAGSLNFQNENFKKSADYYYRLSQTAANKNILADALTGYIKSIDRQNDAEKSVEAARYVMNSPNANAEGITEAKFVSGKAYMKQGETAKALEALRDVASNTKTPSGAQAQYLVIEMLSDDNKLKEAEEEVFKFSKNSTPHQYWLGKSFLVLGDIYVKKGDNFQAKATFQSIVDGYGAQDDGIIHEAKTKLTTLK